MWTVDWAFSDSKLVASFMQLPKEGGNWDSPLNEHVIKLVSSLKKRIGKDNPVRGMWTVRNTSEATVWCDASSLAIGTVLEAV